MNIKIYIHPEFKDTFWTQLSLKATAAEITRKRYTAEYIDAEHVSDIDFDRVFEKAESAGVKYMMVEQDDCNGEDPFECLRRSYEYLKSCGFN